MPVFYVGLILLTVFGARLGWFPVGGFGKGFLDHLYHLFLPAVTLALSLSAVLMRNLRAAMIGVLGAEYVDFARAKGLAARVVLVRHVLRNALISTVTLFGLSIGTLLGGAVITETVFAIPGAGRLMIDSIYGRDYPVVQGLTMVLAVLVSVIFLLTDIVQAWLDPRVGAMSDAAVPAVPVPRRRSRRRATLLAGGALLLIDLALAFFPGLVAPYDPDLFDYNALMAAPSWAHPFGTDNFGRDVLSRVIHAYTTDMQIAVFATLAPFVFGTLIGALVGYVGGWAEVIFGRVVDAVITFPFLVLVIAIVAVLGPGLGNMYIAVGVVDWVFYARLVSAEVKVQNRLDYADAGRVMGYGAGAHHPAPPAAQCDHPGGGLLDDRHGAGDPAGLVAGLSRAGRAAADREWGVQIADGKNFMTTAWWISVFPGIAIVITGLGFSLVGDGLAELLRTRK